MPAPHELVLILHRGYDADALAAQLAAVFGDSPQFAGSAAGYYGAGAQKFVAPVTAPGDLAPLRNILLSQHAGVIAWGLRPQQLCPVKLLVFDTDSTFIDEEVIDELAGYAGYKEHVAGITERAMRGELDFNAALAERVQLLKGLPASTLDAVLTTKLNLTRGARELIAEANKRGIFTYLLSGGFSFFTEAFCRELAMTGNFANELEIVDAHLTGRTVGPIVNRQRKAELLSEIAQKHGVSLERSVAVGDGANDLDMLRLSAMGIAFCAKPALVNATPSAVFERDLRLVADLCF